MFATCPDDIFCRCVFEQSVCSEQKTAGLSRMVKWNWPRIARTNERFALLGVGKVQMISIFGNPPDPGIPYACAENFFRRYDGESTSCFTSNRVLGNRFVHLTQGFYARIIVAQEKGILTNQLYGHACRFCTTAASSSTISNAEDDSRTIMLDESAILIFRIACDRLDNRVHKTGILSLACSHSLGMPARPALKATIPPTMAAFVSQSPPTLMVFPIASTNCSG